MAIQIDLGYLVLFTENGNITPNLARIVEIENESELKDKIFKVLELDEDNEFEMEFLKDQFEKGNDILVAKLDESPKNGIQRISSFEIF